MVDLGKADGAAGGSIQALDCCCYYLRQARQLEDCRDLHLVVILHDAVVDVERVSGSAIDTADAAAAGRSSRWLK